LRPVHRAEVAGVVGPFVPDRHPVLAQVLHVGVAGEKPQELVHDGFEIEFLGGDEREALREVEAHLVAEHRQRAGAGAVGLLRAVGEDAFEKLKILPHAGACFRVVRTHARAGARPMPATAPAGVPKNFRKNCRGQMTTKAPSKRPSTAVIAMKVVRSMIASGVRF